MSKSASTMRPLDCRPAAFNGCASNTTNEINAPCKICGDVSAAGIDKWNSDNWVSGTCLLPLATVADEGQFPLIADGAIVVKAEKEVDDVVVANPQTTTDGATTATISTLYGYRRRYILPPRKCIKLNVASSWDYAQKLVVMVEIKVDEYDPRPFPKLRDELMRAKTTLEFPLPILYTFWRLNPFTELLEDGSKSLNGLGIGDGETLMLCSSLAKSTLSLIVRSELRKDQIVVEIKPDEKIRDLRKELSGRGDFGFPIEDCIFSIQSTGLKLVNEERTLGSCRLKQGDTILVSRKVRGSKEQES